MKEAACIVVNASGAGATDIKFLRKMISDKTIKRFDEANVIDMYNSGMTYAEI